MSKIAFLLTLLATVLIGLLPAVPAQALVNRTFLSAAGSDSNNCANVLTPCRHLATAYAATAANGEIYVLDPANYGSLTITGPVSIEGHGWASIAPVSGSSAIIINASPGDKINIIGVVLDGTALASTSGIQFISGGSLTVRDSVIRNFTNDGIIFQPGAASQLFVSNTLISDNNNGIFVGTSGTGTEIGVLDHVAIEHNASDALHVQSSSAQTIDFTVSDSVLGNNGGHGIQTSATGAQISIMIRNSAISNNTSEAVSSNGTGSTISITRSTITGNAGGWFITGGGVVASYTDNIFDGNTSINTAPPTVATYK